jgi:hypothetical protein
MFPSSSLLSFILVTLAIGSSAVPLVDVPKRSLAFARSVNFSNIVAADQARAKVLQNLALGKGGSLDRRSSSFSVTNTAVTYTANVGVGSPATDYTLLIDTGSSNTWVGAGKKYVKTKTSKSTGATVTVDYGSGSFSGKEFTDTVTLSSALVISKQSIGVASTSSGFTGVDGILGVGPVDLTDQTLSTGQEVPTVSDNLLSQGTISTEVLGIFYAPASEATSTGELTFGGVDSSKTTSEVSFVPITTTSPASEYWGIDESITYGSKKILSSTAGIVDTGTTLVLLATSAFDAYQQATGATMDETTGLLTITSSQFEALQPLNFKIGDQTYTLSANAQIWPRSLNSQIGGSEGNIYLIVSDLGSPVGSGLDFINGYTFLERFYSVFDTTNNRVGFASTEFTTATTN